MKSKIDKIIIIHTPDDSPDLSYLESTIENGIINSCRYSQEELAKHPIRTKRYIKADMERLNNYGRTWNCIGIRAEADISYSIGNGNYRIERLTSGGLYGIESDSDSDYIKSIEDEELADLKERLFGK